MGGVNVLEVFVSFQRWLLLVFVSHLPWLATQNFILLYWNAIPVKNLFLYNSFGTLENYLWYFLFVSKKQWHIHQQFYICYKFNKSYICALQIIFLAWWLQTNLCVWDWTVPFYCYKLKFWKLREVTIAIRWGRFISKMFSWFQKQIRKGLLT